jgi:hypothetical protein
VHADAPVENSDDLACSMRPEKKARKGEKEKKKKIQREAFSSVAEAESTGVDCRERPVKY